jgi:hypothetical protein
VLVVLDDTRVAQCPTPTRGLVSHRALRRTMHSCLLCPGAVQSAGLPLNVSAGGRFYNLTKREDVRPSVTLLSHAAAYASWYQVCCELSAGRRRETEAPTHTDPPARRQTCTLTPERDSRCAHTMKPAGDGCLNFPRVYFIPLSPGLRAPNRVWIATKHGCRSWCST